MCENEEDVVKEISEFYEQVFTTADSIGWEEKFEGILETITQSMNLALTNPFEDKKIKDVFAMNPKKTPGIDGITPLFYQTIWYIVNNDICRDVKFSF